jgi:hypothetical protein
MSLQRYLRGFGYGEDYWRRIDIFLQLTPFSSSSTNPTRQYLESGNSLSFLT